MYMVPFKAEGTIVDIQANVALSGCDSVASLFGIEKKKIVKLLQSGM